MTGAMYAAIGGLKTHMSSLNVIGNNIANVNTVGYKAQRMTFQESIYTTSKAGSNGTLVLGGNNPSQVGYGSQVGSIDLNMSPGTFSPTGLDLDCMIEGDGFFLVGDKDMEFRSAEDYTKPLLTRVGDFWQDAQGYICDRQGNVVFGFATVQNPEYDKNATPEEIAAAATANPPRNIGDQYIVSSCLTPLRLPLAAVEPTRENGGINEQGQKLWDAKDPVYAMLGGKNADDNNSRLNETLADARYYDEDGKLDLAAMAALKDGMGTVSGEGALNNYDGPIPNLQDKCITCDGLKVTETGAITGTCENGQTVVIGYAAIAKVMAPDGVTHVGGRYYKCMEGAGDITVGAVGGIMDGKYLNNKTPGGATVPPLDDALSPCSGTEIQGGGLEASTADVATEFSNMILTQRGYQANTRIVTVTDSMLEELINMKR